MNRRLLHGAIFATPLILAVSVVRAAEVGPAAGSLVLIGDGDAKNEAILTRVLELAGGPEQPFVVIPDRRGGPYVR